MKIVYVTGNWAKVASARQYLEPLGIEVEQVKMDTTEIQSDDNNEIAYYSSKEASDKLKCDVLKNDTGFYIEALNGFPGPYSHYVEDKLSMDDILSMMEGKSNRKAYFKESFAYCKYGKDPIVFESYTRGSIAYSKSGTYGWGWDFIFIPDGEEKTMANFPDEERWKFWNGDGFDKFVEYIKKEN